jgi:hypothetical protein
MNYIKLPYLDSEVSVFDICQAHAQLESDYNVGGILRERFSNRRRNMSTGCQLSRMRYNPGMRWVDILGTDNDDDDENVRDIYLLNVLRMGLPIDATMRQFMANRYTSEFLVQWSAWGAV